MQAEWADGSAGTGGARGWPVGTECAETHDVGTRMASQ